jgi:dihydrolipoamide dehydrogenase
VKQHDGKQVRIQASNVIIAAGSVPIELPFAKFDGKHIVDNVGALDFTEVPKRLGVIGAGVIGLELGSVWRRLGAEVTILEALPDFLAAADADIAKVAAREFKKQGSGHPPRRQADQGRGQEGRGHLTYTDAKGEQTLVVDKLLVAVGRRAPRKGLLAEGTGVKLTDRGRVEGDALHNRRRRRLGHRRLRARPDAGAQGFEEGIAVAELIAGLPGHVNLRHRALGDLHRAGNRLGRQDRSAARPRAFRTRPAASRSPPSAVPWR